MARFKARVLGLVAVFAIAIAIAFFGFWQEHLLTAQAAEEETTYVVQGGDSLYNIARKYRISINALAAANGLAVTDTLLKRQELIIPTSGVSGASQDARAPSTATPAEEEVA